MKKIIDKNVGEVSPTHLHSEIGSKNVIQTQVNDFTLIESQLSSTMIKM